MTTIESLIKLIDSLPLEVMDIKEITKAMNPAMEIISRDLHIAELILQTDIAPNPMALDGAHYTQRQVYSNDPEDMKKAVKMYFSAMGQGRNIVTLIPRKNYDWTEEELHTIQTLGKLHYCVYTRAALARNLRRASEIDMLTGLPNRAGMMSIGRLISEHTSLSEYYGCYYNLKHFRNVNNRYGNFGGDQVLKRFAQKMHEFIIPMKELAGRPGSDYFFFLIRKERFEHFKNHLSNLSIELEVMGKEITVPIHGRMGIYSATDSDTIISVYDNAVMAYAEARYTNKELVEYDQTLKDLALRRKKISSVFHSALSSKEFFPLYQPKVCLETMRMCGCEALVRWNHHGQIMSPADFIPVLESDGTIEELDLYMLNQACADLEDWISRGLEPVRVSVNFSKLDLSDEYLIMKIASIMDRHHIPASLIEIELTETAFYEDKPGLSSFMDQMKELGIEVAMDDFGTGYSSLYLFKDLTFDIVKLDRSFVSQLVSDTGRDHVIVSSMISMLRELKTDMVAEGVETSSQLAMIRELGCNMVQGFLFDRPMPKAEFEERLKDPSYASILKSTED
ncbi:MAG: EAL domain-containing protein [Lachnospiraceae bacterium]|nr:EAL domain-containing protein [Lachnospiraceae bacterium]